MVMLGNCSDPMTVEEGAVSPAFLRRVFVALSGYLVPMDAWMVLAESGLAGRIWLPTLEHVGAWEHKVPFAD